MSDRQSGSGLGQKIVIISRSQAFTVIHCWSEYFEVKPVSGHTCVGLDFKAIGNTPIKMTVNYSLILFSFTSPT